MLKPKLFTTLKDYSKKQTFKIAILEESPITTSLLNVTKNKKIEVKRYKNLKEIGFCNILFVPYNCTVPIETILSKFSGKPVSDLVFQSWLNSEVGRDQLACVGINESAGLIFHIEIDQIHQARVGGGIGN